MISFFDLQVITENHGADDVLLDLPAQDDLCRALAMGLCRFGDHRIGQQLTALAAKLSIDTAPCRSAEASA